MKEILLTDGSVTRVDDEDYPFLVRHSWHRQKGQNTDYAIRYYHDGIKVRAEPMHRAVLDAPKVRLVDHKDGDGLNNIKANLRLCTHAQNMRNRKKHRNGKSRFKGVRAEMRNGRLMWRAGVRVDGRLRSSKRFRSEEEAAAAYNELARQYHGEFARTN